MEGHGFEECIFMKRLEACVSKQLFCLSKTDKVSSLYQHFVVKKFHNVA